MRNISETCYSSRLNHLAQKSDANCVSVLAKQTLIVVIKTDRVGQFFHSELQDEYQRGHRVIIISL